MLALFAKLAGCLALCVALFSTANAAVIGGDHIMDQPMTENLCALTFDDGPTPYTPQLLDSLKQYNIPATFFLLGKSAATYPGLVRRIVADGHEVGNHSWSHPNLKRLTKEGQAAEIENTDATLRSLGAAPLYIRPPYGAYDDRTVEVANRLGASVILWSMDSKDWKRLPENHAKVLSTRGTVYEDGTLRGIFLFHDTHKATVDDLPRIVEHLRAGGCQKFVTVSEYLAGITDQEPPMQMTRRKIFAPDPGYALARGPAPLARCSKPFNAEALNLDDAHAAIAQPETVH